MSLDDLTPDERELLNLLRRLAARIARQAACMHDADGYIRAAVAGAVAPFGEVSETMPAAAADVMLHELRRLRLH